ncbi:MAG: HAMP domain-containing protein, partial [SAR324 cluster bacterium]|nr:HAMP domain-containing protein [SAR324 cluster bacterium]
RNEDGKFTFIADGNGQFTINQPVGIHARFPETFQAATRAWELARPSRTGLFGFGTFEYLQVYVPILDRGEVRALLMINKFAEDVDQAIRAKTLALLALTSVLAFLGAAGFWFFSNRMLSPLLHLKDAALGVAGGDLDIVVPAIKRNDEVSDLNDSFRTMVQELRTNREALQRYNAQLERTLARVRMMEDLERNLSKFVPREVSDALQRDPEALERGKTEKDVTVLFLDLQGSTLLTESLGPRGSGQLIEEYFSKFLDSVYENQGDITETAGDGLMIIFQDERPERHAGNAVLTALAIEATTHALQSQVQPQQSRIMINIGICSGKALVGFTKYEGISGTRVTFTAGGLTTVVAARLADLAVDGSVLMAGETLRRLDTAAGSTLENVRFTPLGERPLKNVHDPVEIYQMETQPRESS